MVDRYRGNIDATLVGGKRLGVGSQIVDGNTTN
jgi:hypothetical protein